MSVSGNPFLPSSALAGEVALKGGSHPGWDSSLFSSGLMAGTERTSAGWRLKRSGLGTAFHALVAL